MKGIERYKIQYLLKKIVDLSFAAFEDKVKLKRENDEIFIGATFINNLHYVESINTLFINENEYSIPVLFRSLLESYVDLVNLCKDKEYYLLLREISIYNKKKRYESWHEPNKNPFYPSIANISDSYRELIRKEDEEIKKIIPITKTKYGKDRKTIKKKFELASLIELYESIYNLNSSDVHNDLSSLSGRFISEKENEIILSLRRVSSVVDVQAHISTIPGVIIESINIVFKRFEVHMEDNFKEELFKIKDEILKSFTPINLVP